MVHTFGPKAMIGEPMCIHIYLYIHSCSQNLCMQKYIYIYRYIYTCIHIYMYTHTHTHTRFPNTGRRDTPLWEALTMRTWLGRASVAGSRTEIPCLNPGTSELASRILEAMPKRGATEPQMQTLLVTQHVSRPAVTQLCALAVHF